MGEENENYLQLDTIFMGVQKVDFKIENAYNNNNISERLFLDIWTNGSILPNDALRSAAQLTIDLFSFLIKEKEAEKTPGLEFKTRAISIEPYYNIHPKSYKNLKILVGNQQMKFFLH